MIVGERVTGSRVVGAGRAARVQGERSQCIIYVHEIVNDFFFSNLVVKHNLVMVKTVKL